MAKFGNSNIFKAYAATVVTALFTIVAAGVAGAVLMAASAIFLLVTRNFEHFYDVLSQALYLLFPFLVLAIANIFGFLASILVLPLIMLRWPSARFYNLMLAGCFAVGPAIWQLIGMANNSPDPYAGMAESYLIVFSSATILLAVICGLFYRRIEHGVGNWLAR